MKATIGLKIFFSFILVVMLVVTTWASLQESIVVGTPKVLAEPWALATLFDAYCGFLTFYVWVAYKETSILSRFVWLLLILSLGNIAMASYVLWQLFSLENNAPLENLLLRKKREMA